MNLSLYDRRPGRLRLISPLTQQKTSAIRNRREWEREGVSAFATVKAPRGTYFPHARRTPLVSILFDAGAELVSGTPTVAPGAAVVIQQKTSTYSCVRFRPPFCPCRRASTAVVYDNKGVSHKIYSTLTSAISFPRSPHPTYTMASEFENLDSDWEITVFPHPKAPGTAHVPPCTDLATAREEAKPFDKKQNKVKPSNPNSPTCNSVRR